MAEKFDELAADIDDASTAVEELQVDHDADADEKLDDLVLERNRLRQAIITKELAEIVGGAEALK